MPQRKAAKSELNKSAKKKQRNLGVKRKVKMAIKTLKKAVESADEKSKEEALKQVYRTLDKAASKKVIHSNKSARTKSRIAKLVNKKKA